MIIGPLRPALHKRLVLHVVFSCFLGVVHECVGMSVSFRRTWRDCSMLSWSFVEFGQLRTFKKVLAEGGVGIDPLSPALEYQCMYDA